MNSRYLGALILSPLIIFLFLGGKYLKALIFLISLRGMYEFYKAVEQKVHPVSFIGYALCIFYYLFMLNNKINAELFFFILILSMLILMLIPIFNEKYSFISGAVTLLGFIYIPIFFSFIVLVSNKTYGNYLVWLIFLSSWLCDTFAYYAGKYFGKNKLCPKISPKKTVEGSIGGLLGSIVGCTSLGTFAISNGVDIGIIHFILIGAISGILSQLGDLVASSIKRYVDVKDYSHLIPGHGGILDRFDSILFSSVTVFYYLIFIIRI
ncbi:phosphatidate cytidylyltransferase [Clostridium cochlearium]|jgi:phosphatidate cytidylyltransferase|uniref:phosphatidate cytidylyltransferase n=1 Tax=Clostridium cochlearium TaxID=1494 RepID=UPI00241CFE0E|nr:phosphatidate cytidylyltransferase [Clostridium cochlearium]MBE6064316.1 phosphatidate cytidylyltransferase [Clostridium cochlearium]